MGSGEVCLQELETAVRTFQARDDGDSIDLTRLRTVVDALEGEFALAARRLQQAGGLLVNGNLSPASWLARNCHMSVTSAADRLCVGEQLESLPAVKQALGSGEIGYQSASVVCHLRVQLGDKQELFCEEQMLGFAREYSVFHLRVLCRLARHVADPDGFFDEAEADYSRRRLHVSLMADGMHAIEGVLDPVGGAAVKTALDALAKRMGPEDDRSRSQRMADALSEVVHHAMDEGRLPRRNGVRPHVSVTATLEGLKNELGAPPAEVELSLPVSTRTLERIACDCTISRVLLADSMVIDVGRATRVVSAPMRRALRVRDRGCRWPGCDRPVNWSNPHHIVAWARQGPSRLSNLVLLCFQHHRLVHEGGWQVINSGREFRFLPPQRVVWKRARGPGMRWAA